MRLKLMQYQAFGDALGIAADRRSNLDLPRPTTSERARSNCCAMRRARFLP